MKFRRRLVPVILILALSAAFNTVFPQGSGKPSRQSSMEAFSKGDYEKAYGEFRELLKIYPRDPLYKYYSAVCLINLNREPAEAQKLLTQALDNAATLKSLPTDAGFYLGRSQQMQGLFAEAEKSYNRFSAQAGKKTAKEYNTEEYIKQCREGKGQVHAPLAENVKTGQTPIKTENKAETKAPEVTGETISPAADKTLQEALILQKKSDSLNTKVAGQKKQLETAPSGEKAIIKEEITGNTRSADSARKAAESKYTQVENMLNPGVKDTVKPPADPVKEPANKSSITSTEVKQGNEINVIQKPEKEIKLQAVSYPEVYSLFEVSKTADPSSDIEVNPEIPEGLVYRIQIAVFKNPVKPAFFKGLTPIYGFRQNGSQVTAYYAGVFRRHADAAKALAAVKAKGFKDAFIVSLNGGKTVSSDRAALLEKEWGKQPLFKPVAIQDVQADTIPPTLAFRVEVARAPQPLKEDVTENMKTAAGKRGLDIMNINGNYVYLIGKFITYESADEYANLLIRNGFKDAKVVSWLGSREIPLETAKQLFENLR